MSAELAVRARRLSKRFRDRHTGILTQALEEVDLAVMPGTLTALVGPDGAGKTTLLRLIAGLMRPDGGELEVLGTQVAQDPQRVQDRISYMPQRFGLYEDLSVQENLDLYADLHGVPVTVRTERYRRLLQMTDLQRFTGRPAGKLSGGMKQKLGLACTLVRSPELLLLDEPTVGVDPLSRRELWQIIQQLIKEEQLSVLVSTAYLDEAQQCDHVCILHQGRRLADGKPEALYASAVQRCFQARLPAGMTPRELQVKLLDASDRIVDAVPQAGGVRFVLQEHTDLKQLQPLLGQARVEPVAPSLEDGFMILLRQQGDAEPALLPPAARTGTNTEEVVIQVRDLVRRFGDFVAVNGVSFDVCRGQIFGLLGPNGAGKTTTFRMLCGLLPSSGGTLQVAGYNLRKARASARARIGYVSQKFSLYSNLTVLENLRFFAGAYGLHGRRLKQRIDAMLEQFDLRGQEKTRSGELPGGYKQRLAMAASLVHEPDILFLDEPTSGADPLARRAFWRRISALAQAGTTVIITTHFMEEAEYCDRILIQDAGERLAIGTPAEVRAQAGQQAEVLSMEETFIRIVEQNRKAAREEVAG